MAGERGRGGIMEPGHTVVPARPPHAHLYDGLLGKSPEDPPVICTFASRHLLTIFEAFLAEAEGVRDDRDIEHLHRMRVALRRMRAAMNTFRACFSDRWFRKVFSATRDVTRALGEARDADVQIAFLKKLRKRARRASPEDGASGRDHSKPDNAGAIRHLLGNLRRQRERCQKQVISALDAYENQKIPDLIRAAASAYAQKHGQRRAAGRNQSTLTVLAAEHIGRCLADLHSYGPFVQYPDAIAEHHAMRIAAKHLRYTMEIFSPLYRLGLRKYIARVAVLQGLLGDLHDTDVWIDSVTLILLKERSRPRAIDDPRRPGLSVIAGLKAFQRDREKERRRIYRSMARYWDRLERKGFWEELRAEVRSNHRARYAAAPAEPEERIRGAVIGLAQHHPEGEAHARHVASLSLLLFDQLGEVHHLPPHDRQLLEYGCLLHDIGWIRGKKGHAKESAAMVHAAETIPFTMDERGVVGFLALLHRGRERSGESGYWHILPAARREQVRMLAGILRVADGLDGMHRGRVRSLACTVTPSTVTCTVVSDSDASREVAMAKEKAGLFEQATGRELRIVQAMPLTGPVRYGAPESEDEG